MGKSPSINQESDIQETNPRKKQKHDKIEKPSQDKEDLTVNVDAEVIVDKPVDLILEENLQDKTETCKEVTRPVEITPRKSARQTPKDHRNEIETEVVKEVSRHIPSLNDVKIKRSDIRIQ